MSISSFRTRDRTGCRKVRDDIFMPKTNFSRGSNMILGFAGYLPPLVFETLPKFSPNVLQKTAVSST